MATPTQSPAKKDKLNLKYLRDKDRELVRGKFLFHEVPGGTMSFSFKAYLEDPVEKFTLVDGQIYSIPLGVARHLNKNLWYPEYSWAQGSNGTQDVHQKITRKVRRCSFQSLEFVDTDDIAPTANIFTVENL